MELTQLEAKYPLSFREEDAKALGEHLKLRHSVELVGMKRVGISNFLRFFLYHKDIVATYINHTEKHLFIPVDLNNLSKIDLFPFWTLTFKRFSDKVEASDISAEIKKAISVRFLETIQSRDTFLTIEALRNSISQIIGEGVMPTFFFLRFDRLASVITEEFFGNLTALDEQTGHKLAYVFTSFRTLDEIAPEVFSRKLLSVFSHPMFVKNARREDMEIIFATLEDKYNIKPIVKVKNGLIDLCGGHVQYLQLSMIVLNQRGKVEKIDDENLLSVISSDERLTLQSEEIWESLSRDEQRVLTKTHNREVTTEAERLSARYLWETGMIDKDNKVFSPLFENYIESLKHSEPKAEKVDLTKKEKLLYDLLLLNKDEVCEREMIIEGVWPEVEELGVSDWTIDRLVARLRTKLKSQKSLYEIVTVKTRGYKLTA